MSASVRLSEMRWIVQKDNHMKLPGTVLFFLLPMLCMLSANAQEKLLYHTIRTDNGGHILPWYDDDPGKSYDHVIGLVWNFWDTMRVDLNGIPYYMNHQVWRPDHNDPRGLGGGQIQMALSSWQLLYRYTGNERVKENMKFLCDYYLSHSLSPSTAVWPDIPFPYNTLVYSGTYDGDMVIGKDFTQPDKAGSFGIELISLYKMTSHERYPNATEKRYLDAAIRIANTLAKQLKPGDENNSPLPFKVNAFTGELGKLKSNTGDRADAGLSSYTTNWSGTAQLFLELIKLKQGDVPGYEKGLAAIISWMKQYPMRNNKWGPFFEDIPGWSDTQINAMTWARFIMNHRTYFPEWKTDVQRIIDWVYKTLGNDSWKKYGVTVVNEQTAYQTPGNSHTSRQAADELLFGLLSGDHSRDMHAVRQLNWATYMVDTDGKNRYPRDENWLTDGYGDYVRHYLRAFEALPSLATGDHVLSSTSVIQHVEYYGSINKTLVPVVPDMDVNKVRVFYRAFDQSGAETIHVLRKPTSVLLNGKVVPESNQPGVEGFSWKTLSNGGTLTVTRLNANTVTVLGEP